MPRFYTQPITRYSKMNHPLYCAMAYAKGDIDGFCRHFFLYLMDRRNRAFFETAIAPMIHELTGWKKNNINRTIQNMVKDKELVRDGHKRIHYSPQFANRVVNFDQNRLGYTGENPDFSEEQRKIVEEIDRLLKRAPYETKYENTEKDEEMSPAIKKRFDELEQQNAHMLKKHEETMAILREIAAGMNGTEAQEKAKKHLTLVKK